MTDLEQGTLFDTAPAPAAVVPNPGQGLRMSRTTGFGNAAEHLVCADLLLNGWVAYLAGAGVPYNVLVDTGEVRLRVQVKSTLAAKTPTMQRRVALESAVRDHLIELGDPCITHLILERSQGCTALRYSSTDVSLNRWMLTSTYSVKHYALYEYHHRQAYRTCAIPGAASSMRSDRTGNPTGFTDSGCPSRATGAGRQRSIWAARQEGLRTRIPR